MLPTTRASGIFNAKRSSAVSVSRLTRMFVPKPKKAFQSPGTQSRFPAFIYPSLSFPKRVERNDVPHLDRNDSLPNEGRQRCEQIYREVGEIRPPGRAGQSV